MTTKTTIRKGSKVQVVREVRGAKVGAVGVVSAITNHPDPEWTAVKVYWVKQADGWVFDCQIDDLARA